MYVCVAVADNCGPTGADPSPNVNVYVLIPIASLDPDASAATGSGADPDVGGTVSAAVGGVTTLTEADAVVDTPALSVTVTVKVYWPGAE